MRFAKSGFFVTITLEKQHYIPAYIHHRQLLINKYV